MFDEEENGGGDHAEPAIYSDWNVMSPMNMHEGDEYEYLDELDGIPHEMPEERAPPPPDERIVEMMREKEGQKDLISCNLSHSAGSRAYIAYWSGGLENW